MPEGPRPAGLYFRVLGPLQVEHAGTPLMIGPPQARTLLAVLVLHRGEVVSADRLMTELWADRPPINGRVQLHGLISRLRRQLAAADEPHAPSCIVTRARGYLLMVDRGQLDVEGFHDDVTAARRLMEHGEIAAAGARLRAALDRWRGKAYADIASPSVRTAAEHLDELRRELHAGILRGRPGLRLRPRVRRRRGVVT
jgi:DNA-binding SARP family transcriptional activator